MIQIIVIVIIIIIIVIIIIIIIIFVIIITIITVIVAWMSQFETVPWKHLPQTIFSLQIGVYRSRKYASLAIRRKPECSYSGEHGNCIEIIILTQFQIDWEW